MSANLDDTIVAISTPAGRGGLGVVRLAGPESRAIAAPLLRLAHELAPGRAVFGEVIEPASGERIDEAVVTFFEKPHSYTTDDIVEISAHGSPVVLAHIVELAMARGARLAEPGEFTMRAFLNGRIDLTQAEAVRDLIESQTLFQAKVAAEQLEGALSKRLAPIKRKLVALIAEMEAGVDFAEDDVSVLSGEQIMARIAEVRAPLQELAHSFAYGKIVNQGLTLAIVGQPNVGKSSLFNRLVERERAIVTASPGTTRDLVIETVSIEGIPVRLVDTAGIRAAGDEAETLGVRKSYEALAEADLALLVLDASQPRMHPDPEILRRSGPQKTILVENKRDIASNPDPVLTSLKKISWDGECFEVPYLGTSAVTGEGIAELRAEILRRVGGNGSAQRESGMLTNLRQQALVRESLAALEAAAGAAANHIPHEMILLDLYNGLRPLDAITGTTTTDDILNLIFSSFCIGK